MASWPHPLRFSRVSWYSRVMRDDEALWGYERLNRLFGDPPLSEEEEGWRDLWIRSGAEPGRDGWRHGLKSHFFHPTVDATRRDAGEHGYFPPAGDEEDLCGEELLFRCSRAAGHKGPHAVYEGAPSFWSPPNVGRVQRLAWRAEMHRTKTAPGKKSRRGCAYLLLVLAAFLLVVRL